MLLSTLLPVLTALPLSLAWSCDSVTLDGATYDLSALKGTHVASKMSDTPPTQSEARARFDVCAGVTREGEDEDQCPDGTHVCLALVNHKKSASPKERVTAVIPVWKSEEPGVNKVDGGIQLLVKGEDFAGSPQSLELTLKCADKASDPVLDSYTNGMLKLEWSVPAACAKGEDAPPAGGDKDKEGDSDKGGEEQTSSGWGFFSTLRFLFWTAFFVLLAYFVIGIVYNHQTYSARGWDLVPHRDFWRELPALTRDLGAHLVANVRQSTGRGGYSSLG